MNKIGLYLSLCAIMVLLLSGCTQNSDLFQAPDKRGGSIEPPEQTNSTLTISTLLPYSSIEALIDRKLPKTVSFSGSKDDCLCANHPAIGTRRQCIQVPYLDFRGAGTQEQCINLPAIIQKRACAGCSWDGTINRGGGVNLLTANNAIRISQPLNISGKAGVRGDLANIFSLSGKNFRADLKPTFDLTFDLNQNWCPVVGVNAHQNWVTSASVEVIGRSCIGIDLGPLGHPRACAGPANIDLTREANDALSSNLSSITKSIKTSISCSAITADIAKQWRSFSLPIKLPQGESLFLNVIPTNAAFSGLIPEKKGLRITVLAGAITKLESHPVENAIIPLPKLERISSTASNLQINLPAQLPFSLLEKVLSAEVKGKEFVKQTNAGNIKIHIEDLTVYPSGSKLVIGLNIDAALPRKIFNTSGWVYLVGTPRIVNNGTAIFVDNLNYATVLDNEFWDIASIVFNDQIMKSLTSKSKIDLTPRLKEYKQTASQEINKAKVADLKISSKSTKIVAKKIYVYNQGLAVFFNLDATFDMDIIPVNL